MQIAASLFFRNLWLREQVKVWLGLLCLFNLKETSTWLALDCCPCGVSESQCLVCAPLSPCLVLCQQRWDAVYKMLDWMESRYPWRLFQGLDNKLLLSWHRGSWSVTYLHESLYFHIPEFPQLSKEVILHITVLPAEAPNMLLFYHEEWNPNPWLPSAKVSAFCTLITSTACPN